jgi:hypothetical protein
LNRERDTRSEARENVREAAERYPAPVEDDRPLSPEREIAEIALAHLLRPTRLAAEASLNLF